MPVTPKKHILVKYDSKQNIRAKQKNIGSMLKFKAVIINGL